MTEDLTEVFRGMSDVHSTEARAEGWEDINSDTAIARAAQAAGKAQAYNNAATLLEESPGEQVPLHEFESTLSTEKLVNHPDRTVLTFEADAVYRSTFEQSVLTDSVEILDDSTIEVTMTVDLPHEL